MSKTIADYTAAITIDGASDFLLIEPSGNTVYKKISRNVLLGLASAPLGTTDSQSPTNKTFDNTNIFTIRDDRLTIQDNSDTTKQAVFQLSGITTATTRTYTMPNASTTLVGTDNTATLTNKTITSPTITGGTIDNTTITVDSIAGHTSSTIVTVANLQISNGVLNSANAVTATSIAAGAVQPQALFTGTGSGWAWQSWTPTPTNWAIGNGTVNGRYNQTGKTINFQLVFTLGNTSTVTGAIQLTLPTTPSSNYIANSPNGSYIGQAAYLDASTQAYSGVCRLIASATIQLQYYSVSGSTVIMSDTSGTTPFSFGNGDRFFIYGTYETT